MAGFYGTEVDKFCCQRGFLMSESYRTMMTLLLQSVSSIGLCTRMTMKGK